MRKLYVKIISRLLVILGFAAISSCDAENEPEFAAEYGTPHADFTLKIKVSDMENKPVEGIRVAIATGYVSHLDNGPVDTVYTSASGVYENTRQLVRVYDHMRLKFEDVDGEENGGCFKTQEVSVPVRQLEKGDGHWYDGKFEASAEVTLEKE